MIGYLRLDAVWHAMTEYARYRLRATICFFGPPSLGHAWGSGEASWWGMPGCACGKKQNAPLVPGE